MKSTKNNMLIGQTYHIYAIGGIVFAALCKDVIDEIMAEDQGGIYLELSTTEPLFTIEQALLDKANEDGTDQLIGEVHMVFKTLRVARTYAEVDRFYAAGFTRVERGKLFYERAEDGIVVRVGDKTVLPTQDGGIAICPSEVPMEERHSIGALVIYR